MPTKKLKIIADRAFSLSEQNDIIPSHGQMCAMQVLSRVARETFPETPEMMSYVYQL